MLCASIRYGRKEENRKRAAKVDVGLSYQGQSRLDFAVVCPAVWRGGST